MGLLSRTKKKQDFGGDQGTGFTSVGGGVNLSNFGSIAPTTSPGGGVRTTISGAGATQPKPILPPLTGTFTDVKTGRPSGIATNQGTFFVQGSDLALLQAQQEKKGALSGSETQPGTIAAAAAQRELVRQQAQAAETTGQARIIPSSGLEGGAFLLQDLKNIKLIKAAALGNLEAARTLGLNELDIAIIQSGQAEVNAFSQFMENVPLAGKIRFRGFGVADIGGKAPRGQIEDALELMRRNTENAADYSTLALESPALIDFYASQIRAIEQDILKFESIIQVISIQSPEVQANPELADKIRLQIQASKNSLAISKAKIGLA